MKDTVEEWDLAQHWPWLSVQTSWEEQVLGNEAVSGSWLTCWFCPLVYGWKPVRVWLNVPKCQQKLSQTKLNPNMLIDICLLKCYLLIMNLTKIFTMVFQTSFLISVFKQFLQLLTWGRERSRPTWLADRYSTSLLRCSKNNKHRFNMFNRQKHTPSNDNRQTQMKPDECCQCTVNWYLKSHS